MIICTVTLEKHFLNTLLAEKAWCFSVKIVHLFGMIYRLTKKKWMG